MERGSTHQRCQEQGMALHLQGVPLIILVWNGWLCRVGLGCNWCYIAKGMLSNGGVCLGSLGYTLIYSQLNIRHTGQTNWFLAETPWQKWVKSLIDSVSPPIRQQSKIIHNKPWTILDTLKRVVFWLVLVCHPPFSQKFKSFYMLHHLSPIAFPWFSLSLLFHG
jgi:hypothetical protein